MEMLSSLFGDGLSIFVAENVCPLPFHRVGIFLYQDGSKCKLHHNLFIPVSEEMRKVGKKKKKQLSLITG